MDRQIGWLSVGLAGFLVVVEALTGFHGLGLSAAAGLALVGVVLLKRGGVSVPIWMFLGVTFVNIAIGVTAVIDVVRRAIAR